MDNKNFMVYGVRPKGEKWMFTTVKRDRDHFWENTQRYDSCRNEFEQIDRIMTPAEWISRGNLMATKEAA